MRRIEGAAATNIGQRASNGELFERRDRLPFVLFLSNDDLLKLETKEFTP